MNDKQIWIFIIGFFLITGNVYAQKETMIWYYGEGYGFDFKYSPPRLLTDGAIRIAAGPASICDAEGNLLFYSNGETVWNKEHKPMPNGTGLKGSYHAAQSALIIPHPGNSNQYYLFTVSGKYDPIHVRCYSLIDMRMDGGLGDVIEKNILQFSNTKAMQTGTLHSNGRDFWAISVIESDLVVATLITPDGVGQSRITKIPNVHFEYRGLMKASPNGKYIAISTANAIGHNRNSVRILRFCNETGAVEPLSVINENLMVGGVSFTADSRFLYWTLNQYVLYGLPADRYIYRMEICENSAWIPERLQDSVHYTAGLELGLDKKIYFTSVIRGIDHDNKTYRARFAGSIEHPADINDMPIILPELYDCNENPVIDTIWAHWGMVPSFIQSYFDPFFQASLGSDTVVCADQPVELTYYPRASVLWSTGDTTEVLTVTEPGTYSVIASHLDNPGWIRYDTIVVAHKPCTEKCNELQTRPNPNHGQFSVSVEEAVPATLELFARNGQIVALERLEGNHINPYPVTTLLSPGTYLLRYTNEVCQETVKVVVFNR